MTNDTFNIDDLAESTSDACDLARYLDALGATCVARELAAWSA